MSATILFDIDGTLLSFPGVGRRAMERAIEETWGISRALEGVSFFGATDGALVSGLAAGRPREPMWRLYLSYLDRGISTLRETAPLPGVTELLTALERESQSLAILTGNLREGARIKLRAAGLAERFDWTRSAFGEDGDAREAVASAARRRCGEETLIVVGDSIADIRCARHIGARAVAVATGGTPREVLAAEGPDLLLDSLSAGPSLLRALLALAG